jgi:hypothetical protein
MTHLIQDSHRTMLETLPYREVRETFNPNNFNGSCYGRTFP